MTHSHVAPSVIADDLDPLVTEQGADALTVANATLELSLALARPQLRIGSAAIACVPAAGGRLAQLAAAEVLLDTPTLLRVRYAGTLGEDLRATVTFDVYQSRNVHVYARVEALAATTVEELQLPRVTVEAGGLAAVAGAGPGRRWIDLAGEQIDLGVVVKKLPWKASWNDVGCHAHWTLASARLDALDEPAGVTLAAPDAVALEAGDTIEAGLMLIAHRGDVERVRREATHDLRDETRYVPEGERMQTMMWETEDVWLGPPITDGAPQRPSDQLIPRPAGLNVLARKRFNWNNEDFGLYRLTGKDGYWEAGIKKAHALLSTQNEHGGWFEGIEFYGFPPRHHQMYDTYIGGMFLLEAYDATGYDGFLEGARRCRDFWLGAPPANGHTEVGDGGWWYRWGGYVNEFGYTDERHVLNTHAGATAFLALLHERTGDELALEAAQRGMAAVRWGLERGIQRGDGQFLYSLSQIDPTLARPGDPPYVQLDLVPQIEDVYTIATSYRLMLANRLLGDAVVTAAIERALAFWWTGYRAGTTITYRAYATLAFAIAAGEIDPVYALALPDLLKDREHFTSMQRGLSSFVLPAGLPRLKVSLEGCNGALVEPVFVRQQDDRLVTALVNLEHGQRGLGVHVALPPGRSPQAARIVDPATRTVRGPAAVEPVAGGARVVVPELGELSVVLLELDF